MNTDFIQIASYASKAPSGHNTQPWKFHIADNTITVIPNFEVALPVVDGNNRELFISLGCAVENLSIAANHFGYTTQIVEYSIKGIILELTVIKMTHNRNLLHLQEHFQNFVQTKENTTCINIVFFFHPLDQSKGKMHIVVFVHIIW